MVESRRCTSESLPRERAGPLTRGPALHVLPPLPLSLQCVYFWSDSRSHVSAGGAGPGRIGAELVEVLVVKPTFPHSGAGARYSLKGPAVVVGPSYRKRGEPMVGGGPIWQRLVVAALAALVSELIRQLSSKEAVKPDESEKTDSPGT